MKPLFKWRHQYDQDRDTAEGDAAAIECKEPSLTQQSFKDDADINVLAQRFGLTTVPLAPLDPALFRDTTQDPDLRDVLETQRMAKEQFMGLPAKLRRRFHNSPRELWDFVNDPENAEEAVRLGLLTRQDTATADQGRTTADAKTNRGPASTAPTATSTNSSNAGGDGNPPPHTPEGKPKVTQLALPL